MNEKLTPGPWTPHIAVGDGDVPKGSLVVTGTRTQLGVRGAVTCVVAPAWNISEEDYHNSKLISAAPDLLEALIELRDWYLNFTGLPAVKANKAIAKTEEK